MGSTNPSIERLTPDRRRALTRDTLLDAAAAVFGRKGYEAGTLEEIADAAGFTTGAIYSNFGNKQELFLQVIERRNTRLLDDYRRMLETQAASGGHDLAAVASVWFEHELGDENALLLTLEVRLAALRDPEIKQRVAAFERHTEAMIAGFIAEQLRTANPPLALAMATEQFAALVYAANQGIWQHVAICNSDHEGLFQALLEVLTREIHQAE